LIEAAMIWNEPNNKSHWEIEFDTEWLLFGDMAKRAAAAIASEAPHLPKVLGGISPIDPGFIRNMDRQGVLAELDAVAVHGFPLDWNLWPIDAWPAKLREIQAVTTLPVWVSEVGISSFGAEEVQDWGLQRTAELLHGAAPRVHWYSLYDLPRAWPATTRHREAEGSSYYRHFHMGLLDECGRPKRALARFADLTPGFGLCQWFHFDDHRLDDAVRWMRELGVIHLRTGLSWADWKRPNAALWFDRLMSRLDPFEVTATFCFTPESDGVHPHHTSPPRDPDAFAEFCATMLRRYRSAGSAGTPRLVAASVA
jgi:beta-xylosidase